MLTPSIALASVVMPKRKAAGLLATPAIKKQVVSGVTALVSSTSGTRYSSRLKSSPIDQTSFTKSKYFENIDDEDEDEAHSADDAESGYEDEDASMTEESASEISEDDSDANSGKSRRDKASKVRQQGSDAAVYDKNDLWREGVKTGLGPGKQVFIERPKARGDGGIKYVPERLHPNTLEFLKDLKKNNDRIWLKAHDADYRSSWADFSSFVEVLSEKIAEIDDTIPELPPKDLVFRVYRDVRFSSDPTPYKPHFSAAFSRTGRKGPYACYYVHIQPGGKCFVSGGLWHPEAAPIASLRADINSNPGRIKDVLTNPGMRKHIFGGISKDTKKAVKAFCMQNEENALKTKPKVDCISDSKRTCLSNWK